MRVQVGGGGWRRETDKEKDVQSSDERRGDQS